MTIYDNIYDNFKTQMTTQSRLVKNVPIYLSYYICGRQTLQTRAKTYNHITVKNQNNDKYTDISHTRNLYSASVKKTRQRVTNDI